MQRRSKPAVTRNSWSWRGQGYEPDSFKSVDGDKIFHAPYWRSGRRVLYWGVAAALNRTQKMLITDIEEDVRSIALEGELSGESKQIGATQIPYRECGS